MAAVTTTTLTTIGISMLWPFLPTLIMGFIVSYIKCKNYRCSIKYGLLVGTIIGTLYGAILSLLLMPVHQNFDISANFSLSLFEFSLKQSSSNGGVNMGPDNTSLIVSIMAISIFIHMVIGSLGGLFSGFVRKNEDKGKKRSIRRNLKM